MPPTSDTQPLRAQMRPLVAEFRSLVDQTMPISLVDPGVTIDAIEHRRAAQLAVVARMSAVVDGPARTGRGV